MTCHGQAAQLHRTCAFVGKCVMQKCGALNHRRNVQGHIWNPPSSLWRNVRLGGLRTSGTREISVCNWNQRVPKEALLSATLLLSIHLGSSLLNSLQFITFDLCQTNRYILKAKSLRGVSVFSLGDTLVRQVQNGAMYNSNWTWPRLVPAGAFATWKYYCLI